jgi:hypothetical protein
MDGSNGRLMHHSIQTEFMIQKIEKKSKSSLNSPTYIFFCMLLSTIIYIKGAVHKAKMSMRDAFMFHHELLNYRFVIPQ